MARFIRLSSLLLLLLSLGTLWGCASGNTASGSLVIYSSRNEAFVDPLIDQFREDTGISVQILHAGSGAVSRIIEEAGNVQADVFISNDVGAMEFLRMEGLLRGSEPAGIATIHSDFRATDNSWFALSARTRVLMYNQNMISEADMPQTIWELSDPKWQGQFAITRGGNSGMIAHVSALRYAWGDDQTAKWLASVRENAGAIMQGHGDIRRSVGAGEYAFGLVNNYYYHQQLLEPTDNEVGVIYPDQAENEMGAVINAAGIALLADSPSPESALAFLEWILQPENQRDFSYASLEVPVNPEIEAIEQAATLQDYKVQDMPLNRLGDFYLDTRDLIEQSGLDLELR